MSFYRGGRLKSGEMKLGAKQNIHEKKQRGSGELHRGGRRKTMMGAQGGVSR